MMGVLSELLVRIYHESQSRRPYKVRRFVRSGTGDHDPEVNVPVSGAVHNHQPHTEKVPPPVPDAAGKGGDAQRETAEGELS
jgi:hypothetical protein